MKQRYKLLKEYPGRKIGDIAIFGFGINDAKWEDNNYGIPVNFRPDMAPDWWEKVENEKTLEDYERMLGILFSDVVPIPPEGLAFSVPFKYLELTNPQIYWTEVLKVIAQDLNKGKTGCNVEAFIVKDAEGYCCTTTSRNYVSQGTVYFHKHSDCQKAIDLLGSNVKHLFNE